MPVAPAKRESSEMDLNPVSHIQPLRKPVKDFNHSSSEAIESGGYVHIPPANPYPEDIMTFESQSARVKGV